MLKDFKIDLSNLNKNSEKEYISIKGNHNSKLQIVEDAELNEPSVG